MFVADEAFLFRSRHYLTVDKERRTLLNAVGPVWDGNEVWLLTGGGAIFADSLRWLWRPAE